MYVGFNLVYWLLATAYCLLRPGRGKGEAGYSGPTIPFEALEPLRFTNHKLGLPMVPGHGRHRFGDPNVPSNDRSSSYDGIAPPRMVAPE